jgi:hypothetical protein
MGYLAEIVNTGGGVMALALTVDDQYALLSLDGGRLDGTTWVVALDGETRQGVGEYETAELPVTSDSDQTIADAVAWVRHIVWGEPLAD